MLVALHGCASNPPLPPAGIDTPSIPIAVMMGVYGRYLRPARIGEMSVIGFVLLMLSLVFGRHIADDATLAPLFDYTGEQLSMMLIAIVLLLTIMARLIARSSAVRR